MSDKKESSSENFIRGVKKTQKLFTQGVQSETSLLNFLSQGLKDTQTLSAKGQELCKEEFLDFVKSFNKTRDGFMQFNYSLYIQQL